MTDRCPKCGLPTWKRTGGMGGDLPPDYESYCDRVNGHTCRMRRASYVAGIRAGVELAKRTARPITTPYHIEIDWTETDAELARVEKGGDDGR